MLVLGRRHEEGNLNELFERFGHSKKRNLNSKRGTKQSSFPN